VHEHHQAPIRAINQAPKGLLPGTGNSRSPQSTSYLNDTFQLPLRPFNVVYKSPVEGGIVPAPGPGHEVLCRLVLIRDEPYQRIGELHLHTFLLRYLAVAVEGDGCDLSHDGVLDRVFFCDGDCDYTRTPASGTSGRLLAAGVIK